MCIFALVLTKTKKMKYIISILLMFIALKLSAPNVNTMYIEHSEGLTDPFVVLWDWVSWVEARQQDIISKTEPAYGRGQITKAKLREFNAATGKHYTLKDCLKEPISREIFLWHCKSYKSFEWAAKRWNGSGKAIIKYWNKVETMPLLEYRLTLIKLKTWKIEKFKLRLRPYYCYSILPVGDYQRL